MVVSEIISQWNHLSDKYLPQDIGKPFFQQFLTENSKHFAWPGGLSRHVKSDFPAHEQDKSRIIIWLWHPCFKVNAPGMDVSGLVAGILAVIMSAVIATVLGICFCKGKFEKECDSLLGKFESNPGSFSNQKIVGKLEFSLESIHPVSNLSFFAWSILGCS